MVILEILFSETFKAQNILISRFGSKNIQDHKIFFKKTQLRR